MDGRPNVHPLGVMLGVLFVVCFLFFMPALLTVISNTVLNVDRAVDRLTSRGYIVLAAGEYELLNSKLDSIATKAEAAAEAAADAVTAAELAAAKVDLFNTADTFLFPADTDYYVLLTADAASGEFSSWAEIVDNNAVTLSSKFADNAGYISDIYIYQVTAPADTTNIVEIAYGESKTSLTRIMFNSDNLNIAQIKSRLIPAGETIYYRIMTDTAPTEYVSIGFRYFYE